MADVAVVGAGAWGSALAIHAARRGHAVRLWAFEEEVAGEIEAARTNSVYLPGAGFPEGLSASADAGRVVAGAACVVLVPPSKHLRAIAGMIATAVPGDADIVVASKGIEESSLKLMSEVLEEVLPGHDPARFAFLSGPSFAKEVARGLPADVVVASRGAQTVQRVQELLHTPMFRVYSSDDPIGVQVGGALKNVVAVATGACDGLGLGLNARAALITRGLAEITRVGVALGADPLTFLGMAGVGDLVLTCTGDLSRNRTLGKQLAEGADAAAYLASRRSVAEGYTTAAAAHALAAKLGIDAPLTDQVYHVLHRGRPLQEALQLLVSRAYKEELRGIRSALREGPR